jgi:hypothetical protein
MMVLGLPLIVFYSGSPYTVCAVLLAITGTGFAYGLGLQRAFLDSVAEPMRGQAFGLLASGLMTMQGVGPAVFGGLAQLASTGSAIAYAGLATLGTAAWMTATSGADLGVSQAES